MPSTNGQKLHKIRRLLGSAPLSLSAAEKVVVECAALSQDSASPFIFFVLKHVFGEISDLLEGEAVGVNRHAELTEETRQRGLKLFERETFEGDQCLAELKELVEEHLVKASMFWEEPNRG